jgi:ABC-type dipeptide/oligopeptide/nickel transport system permease subunit
VLPAGWWLSVVPGLAIAILVVSLALVGDALQPGLRKSAEAPGVVGEVRGTTGGAAA